MVSPTPKPLMVLPGMAVPPTVSVPPGPTNVTGAPPRDAPPARRKLPPAMVVPSAVPPEIDALDAAVIDGRAFGRAAGVDVDKAHAVDRGADCRT